MVIRLLLAGLLTVGMNACGGAQRSTEIATDNMPGAGATISDGETMVEHGEYEKAKALFQRIVDQSPDNPKAHYYLALTTVKTGDLEGAVSHYEKAIALDSKLMDAHINLGLLLMETGNLDRAEKELKIYLDASPDAADAHFNYGLVQERRGQIDKAKSHYEQAAKIDPEDPSPLFGLGDLAREQGDKQEAIKLYEQARALDGEIPELVYIEGTTLLEMNQTERACSLFKGLLEMASPNLLIVNEAGKAIAKVDNECAVTLYKGALALDDGFATAHFYLGNALARDKQFKEAAFHFEKFIDLAPDDPAAKDAQKRLEACQAQYK